MGFAPYKIDIVEKIILFFIYIQDLEGPPVRVLVPESSVVLPNRVHPSSSTTLWGGQSLHIHTVVWIQRLFLFYFPVLLTRGTDSSRQYSWVFCPIFVLFFPRSSEETDPRGPRSG